MHLNASRIGSAFLGRVLVSNDLGLKRIGSMESKIIEIKDVPKGYSIGYSGTEKTKRASKIAIIPVGYGDGFRITVSNDMFRVVDRLRNLKASVMELLKKGQVTVNVEGKTCKVLGQIGMCHTAIDITDINAKIGDNVTMNINPIFVKENVRREYR
jgi:alanine racemase